MTLRASKHELDLESLQYLVSRLPMARAVWNSSSRRLVVRALSVLHRDDEERHKRAIQLISTQALLTYMKALVSGLTNFHVKLREKGVPHANKILNLIEDLLDCREEDLFSLASHLIRDLLLITVHAAIAILKHQAGEAGVRTEYRRLVDYIRARFPESIAVDDEVKAVKDTGITVVKSVSIAMVKSNRNPATKLSTSFVNRHPIENLVTSIATDATRIEDEIGELRLITMLADAGKRKGTEGDGRKSKRLRRSTSVESLPSFFSSSEGPDDIELDDVEGGPEPEDVSNEVFNVPEQAEGIVDGISRTRTRPQKSKEGTERDSDSESGESFHQHTRSPKRNRRRPARRSSHSEPAPLNSKSNRNADGVLVSEPEDSDFDTGKKAILTTKTVIDEISSDDYRSDQEEERVDHVVRHAQARPSRKRVAAIRKPKPARKNPRPKRLNAAKKRRGEVQQPEDERESNEIQPNSPGGEETLKDLQKATSRLEKNGIPDPLDEALAAARSGGVRRRRGLAALGEGGRDVSPIPDTEDKDFMPFKKRSSLMLDKSPATANGVQHAVDYWYGKEIRKGRFLRSEDQWLLDGLERFGWGAWIDISQYFWKGTFTRTAGSLKDRARTMKLSEKDFPVQKSRGRRGRRPGARRRKTGEDSQDEIESDSDENYDDEDRDEDEGEKERKEKQVEQTVSVKTSRRMTRRGAEKKEDDEKGEARKDATEDQGGQHVSSRTRKRKNRSENVEEKEEDEKGEARKDDAGSENSDASDDT